MPLQFAGFAPPSGSGRSAGLMSRRASLQSSPGSSCSIAGTRSATGCAASGIDGVPFAAAVAVGAASSLPQPASAIETATATTRGLRPTGVVLLALRLLDPVLRLLDRVLRPV